MDDHLSRFGRVRTCPDSPVQKAHKEGYTQTILGRRRYPPDLNLTSRQARETTERVALNVLVQESMADVIRFVMVVVVDSMKGMCSCVLLQAHDEFILGIAPGECGVAGAVVRREMENAAESAIPLSVGVGVGPFWCEAAH